MWPSSSSSSNETERKKNIKNLVIFCAIHRWGHMKFSSQFFFHFFFVVDNNLVRVHLRVKYGFSIHGSY